MSERDEFHARLAKEQRVCERRLVRAEWLNTTLVSFDIIVVILVSLAKTRRVGGSLVITQPKELVESKKFHLFSLPGLAADNNNKNFTKQSKTIQTIRVTDFSPTPTPTTPTLVVLVSREQGKINVATRALFSPFQPFPWPTLQWGHISCILPCNALHTPVRVLSQFGVRIGYRVLWEPV